MLVSSNIPFVCKCASCQLCIRPNSVCIQTSFMVSEANMANMWTTFDVVSTGVNSNKTYQ
jgi:hypothetical protein